MRKFLCRISFCQFIYLFIFSCGTNWALNHKCCKWYIHVMILVWTQIASTCCRWKYWGQHTKNCFSSECLCPNCGCTCCFPWICRSCCKKSFLHVAWPRRRDGYTNFTWNSNHYLSTMTFTNNTNTNVSLHSVMTFTNNTNTNVSLHSVMKSLKYLEPIFQLTISFHLPRRNTRWSVNLSV